VKIGPGAAGGAGHPEAGGLSSRWRPDEPLSVRRGGETTRFRPPGGASEGVEGRDARVDPEGGLIPALRVA
jgi:hypothetical protein